MSNELLVEALKPMIERLSQLDLADPATEATMKQEFATDNEQVRSVIDLAKSGIEAGWLCDRENSGVKYSRVAKPADATFDFSIDAVLMSGQGPTHSHPNGELSLCIPMDGSPQFDNFDGIWALYGPGSSHTPTVTGGSMLILYLLPEGAMDWS